MAIPDFILRLAGRRIAATLGLKEDSMNETKPWYQSKTIIACGINFLVGVYGLVGQFLVPALHFHLPAIPGMLLTVLSAMGVYGRIDADTKIG